MLSTSINNHLTLKYLKMKNLKRISILVLLVVALFTSSCEKEPTVNPKQTPNYNTDANLDLGNKVNAKFFGRIVDESGNPVSGVEIKAGDKMASTDNKGIFIIENASVFEKMAYISASKSGYFLGSRSVIPSTSATNNVRITLLAMNIVGTVNSGEEKTIALSSGAKIDFKGNYIDVNGNAYTGTVNIAFKHLPALAEATADQMPGMLYAQNKDEEAGILETYGMMAVELTSTSGAELQIDPDSKATIHMPVDASQLSNAPATIPLWHFDEVAGYWIEEGEATLIGGEYVGDVHHFSFWNCDRFGDDAQINGLVTDQSGNPISGVIVTITTPNAYTAGYTNSDGTFSTYIPANANITLEVKDDCWNSLVSSNVGPFAINTVNSETLAVTLTASNSVLVSGLFYDCSNALITNGYVELTIGSDKYYQTITNGIIDIPVIFCVIPASLSVIAYDYDNIQETNSLSMPLVSPITNLGNLIACNSISEYVTYSIDGGTPTTIFPPFNYSENNNNFSVTTTGFEVFSDTTTLGSYPWGNTDGMTLYSNDIAAGQGQPVNITFQLLSYGATVGSYVDITFSGNYTDYITSANRTITGTIHVKKD